MFEFDKGTIDTIFYIQEDTSDPGWIDALALFFEIQAHYHPKSLARAVGVYLVTRADPKAAAMAHLAGVPFEILQEEVQDRNAACEAFLTKISSAHGRMALRNAIPDTAALLRDDQAWRRFHQAFCA